LIKAGSISFGGMNQDMSAQDPRRSQFYYEGQNITLIFNGQLSQNVISNEKGNKLLVSLPNIALANNTGGTTPIWQSNPDDDLLFTEDTTLTTLPLGSQGRIVTHPTLTDFNSIIGDIGNATIQYSYYGPEFDEYYSGNTASILGSSQIILGGSFIKNSLVVISMSESNVSGNGHLCVWEITYDNDYNATTYLKFLGPYAGMNKSYPITKIETFYESDLIQKVYWTDALNQLRTVNIKHNLPFFRNIKTIDSTPEWDLSPITIHQSINGSGEWSEGAGMVQYGYRLYVKNGPTTKLSPLSGLAPILKDLHGVPTGESGNTLFKVSINDVDTSFEWIEIYRFRIDDSGAVVAYLIHEGEVGPRSNTTDTVNILALDKGDSSVIRIQSDLAGLRFGVSGPYIPRTFEIKDNRVFLGNIEETVFDVDYDARAYSFTNTTDYSVATSTTISFTESNPREAKLRSADGGYEETISGTNPTWPTNTKLDAINKSVLALPNDNTYFERYQYKADGITQGGEGPNVAFEFEFEYSPISSYFKYPEYYSKGAYKTGEPYRFGIQFFDKYGNGSFVNWIADIRMPELKRLDDARLYRGSTNKFKLLYPRFTLANLGNLPDTIHSLRIVRAVKDPEDRLILSQGYLNHTLYSFDGGEWENDTRTNYHDDQLMPYYGLGYYNGGIRTKGGCLTNPGDAYDTATDISETHAPDGKYIKKSFYLALYLPEITYGLSTIAPSTNNTMRVVAGSRWSNSTNGLSSVTSNGYSYERTSSGGTPGYETLSNWRNVYDPPTVGSTWTGDLLRAGIATNHKVVIHKALFTDRDFLPRASREEGDGYNGYTSISSIAQTTPMGTPIGSDIVNVGGGVDYINHTVVWATLDTSATPTFSDTERYGMVGKGPNSYIFSTGNDLGTANKWFDTTKGASIFYTSSNPTYPLIEYINPNVNPFGGNSYENRQNTQYIPCTDLIPIENQSSIRVTAYGGDTFPQLYETLLLDYNEDTTGNYQVNRKPYQGAETGASLSLEVNTTDLTSHKTYISLPVETYCNLYHVNGKTGEGIHKVPKSTYQELPSYNQIYNRQNKYDIGFAKSAKFTGVQNFNTMTRYSDVKIINQNIDNLCIFKPNNFNNVDAQLGAISAFHIFGDNLFVIQERGVGIWLVNPTAVASTSSGPTSLGTGGVLHDYRIISSQYGSAYSFGSVVGSRGVYVLDMNKRKFLSMTDSANSISDINGLHARLTDLQKTVTDDMYGNGTGVRLHYDPITFNVYVSIYYDDSDTGNVIDVSEPLPS
jgi:hypothetical protein